MRKIIDTPWCTFCGQEEIVDRLFWKCDITQKFWSEFKIILHKNCNTCSNFSFSEELVLPGTTTTCTTVSQHGGLLIGWSLITEVFQQGGLSSGLFFIRVVRWSLISVVIH